MQSLKKALIPSRKLDYWYKYKKLSLYLFIERNYINVQNQKNKEKKRF